LFGYINQYYYSDDLAGYFTETYQLPKPDKIISRKPDKGFLRVIENTVAFNRSVPLLLSQCSCLLTVQLF